LAVGARQRHLRDLDRLLWSRPRGEKGETMRKLASIRVISNIGPIAGADRIELATVDGWKCVVKRGDFEAGTKVIYCEIDSLLPIRPEFEFLRKSSYRKMDEREGFRLKTMTMRGQVSQGLLLPMSALGRDAEVGEDVTGELGIVKYEPPVPTNLAGEVVGGFPGAISKTDEERIQNLAADFASMRGALFHASEKLDGTSLTVFHDERIGVCGRNWEYAESDKNSYWQVVKALDLPAKLAALGRRIAIQGELVGPKIQKNRYQRKQLELYVFNAFDMSTSGYLAKAELSDLCAELGLAEVPVVFERELPATIDEVLELAEGKSALAPDSEREGLVWVHGAGPGRISFKAISNRFLTRGGT
jgi:RNA ligase (TIGR02306 family)